MATTTLLKVKADVERTAGTVMKDCLNYILDQSKTTSDNYRQTQNLENLLNSPLDYATDGNKTKNQSYVTGYECTPSLASEQFADDLRAYVMTTGREVKSNSVLLYHLRQAFKPGEVDPATANEIGQRLAMEFTKGEHAFVVSTHTDKAHVHNHIMINAVNLSRDGKFKDPWRSGKRDVAPLSDEICREYGLSVVEHESNSLFAGNSKYHWEWQKEKGITKPLTAREQFEDVLLACLSKKPKTLEELLEHLPTYHCKVNHRGGNISITTPFSKQNIKLSSLSAGFTEADLRERIAEQLEQDEASNNETVQTPTTTEHNRNNLLEPFAKPKERKNSLEKNQNIQLIIDLNNSIKATESIGYKRWAEKHNLEQMSKVLLLLEKHDLTFDDLEQHTNQKHETLKQLKVDIEVVSEKLDNVSTLQRHMGSHSKGREIYKQYTNASVKDKPQLRMANDAVIANYEKAQAYFDEHNYGFGEEQQRLPSMKDLKQSYMSLATERQKLWSSYNKIKKSDKDYDLAYQNIKTLLQLDKPTEVLEHEPKQTHEQHQEHEAPTQQRTKEKAPKKKRKQDPSL